MTAETVMWSLLMQMVLLLGAAYLLGVLAQRFLQSAIIGYLLAGSVAGQFLFEKAAVAAVAELGVALLLFSIGLELSFRQLRVIGRKVLIGGALQVVVTLVVIASGLSFVIPMSSAVVVGAALALSSTAIVMRVLQHSGAVDSVRGRSALGILLVQDLTVVPLVLMVSMMGGDGGFSAVALALGRTLLAVAGLMAIFYLLFYRIIPWLLHTGGLFANRELTMLLAILSGIGSTWSAHAVGLSPALGAFAAGILLAESPFATQIRADTDAIRTLFVTLFFTSVGMLLDVGWLVRHVALLLPAVALILAVKTGIVFAIFKAMRIDSAVALATGISLGQVGEFAFVLMAAARERSLLDEATLTAVVATALLSMFAAPYMVRYADPLARRLLPRRPSRAPTAPDASASAIGCTALVVGWGPAGKKVALALKDVGLRPEIIELNPASRASAARSGFSMHLGDATQSEVLLHAGVGDAGVVVVTAPDTATAHDVIKAIRAIAPVVPIVARGRYHRHASRLKDAGATIVVDEEQEVGGRLAEEVRRLVAESDMHSLVCRLAGVGSDAPHTAPAPAAATEPPDKAG
ncbi:MAG: cation:proton antiporter [Pseudomonadota bacterium]